MSRTGALAVAMSKRRRRRATRHDDHGLGVFERAMFTFLGPPQLGENRPPDGYVPDEAANFCHRCGQPWAEHQRIDSGRFHYRQCPGT